MLRLAGINIADNRQIWIGLADIFGIGPSLARKILKEQGIAEMTKAKDLSEADVEKLRAAVAVYKIEGDLRTEIQQNVKHHLAIGTYKGGRHAKKLPVNGQRTKTNSRTKRGKRVTVGSGRKKAAAKT
jgi:small subunit ribosomal protein S13